MINKSDHWCDIIKLLENMPDDYGGICMSINSFNDMLNIPKNNYYKFFDPVTVRELLVTGYYSNFKLKDRIIKIIVNKRCDMYELISLPVEVTDNYSLSALNAYLEKIER